MIFEMFPQVSLNLSQQGASDVALGALEGGVVVERLAQSRLPQAGGLKLGQVFEQLDATALVSSSAGAFVEAV